MPPKKRLRRLADLEREEEQANGGKKGQESGSKEESGEASIIPETPEKLRLSPKSQRRQTRSATAALQRTSTSTANSLSRTTKLSQGPRRSRIGIVSAEAVDDSIASSLRRKRPSRKVTAQAKSSSESEGEVRSTDDVYDLTISDHEDSHAKRSNKKLPKAPAHRTNRSSIHAANLISVTKPKGTLKCGIRKNTASSTVSGSPNRKAELKPQASNSAINTTALPPRSISPVSTANNYRSISSLFGRTLTQHVSKNPPQSLSARATCTAASTPLPIGAGITLDAQTQAVLVGVEKLEDLLDDLSDIDDFTDDEDLVRPPATQQRKANNGGATNANLSSAHLMIPSLGRSQGTQYQRILPGNSGGSQAFLSISLKDPCLALAAASSSQPSLTTHTTLPWPMKHTPITSNGLAVHVKKVAELASILKDLYEGYSMKRVLLLKGPAGCGKTVTLQTLTREGGWDIVEWVNPSITVSSYSRDNCDGSPEISGSSFAFAFEDWLFRSGKWGCLDLVRENPAAPIYAQSGDSSRKKLLLLEDLPNLSHPGTLLSFRSAIRQYLSLPRPLSPDPPIPPLVIIISECSEGAGSSTNMGMGAHKIFGAPILSHPLVAEICFRRVAKTLLVKCLGEILRKEGFTGVFGKEMLEQLSETGDLRAAISGLEVLLLGKERNPPSQLSRTVAKGRRNAKPKKNGEVKDESYAELLNLLQPRLSMFGLFHTIGKIVYNKRYGDDPSDPYADPPPSPSSELKPYQRYHTRAMKLDPNTILDESGVDANMFIYGVQENYLASCTSFGGKPGGSSASGQKKLDVLSDVCFCVDGLSDGDILMGTHMSWGGNNGDIEAGIARASSLGWGVELGGFASGGRVSDAMLRQEEIAAQVVVRSLSLGLPSPVKRDQSMGGSRKGGGFWAGGGKIFYPMGLRLWRKKEELEGCLEICEHRIKDGKYDGIVTSASASIEVGEKGEGNFSEILIAGLTKAHLVLERLPFMAYIARARLRIPFSSNPQRQNNTHTMMNKWGIGTISGNKSSRLKHSQSFQLTNKSSATNLNSQHITRNGNTNYGPNRSNPISLQILYELERVTALTGLGMKQTDADEDDLEWKLDEVQAKSASNFRGLAQRSKEEGITGIVRPSNSSENSVLVEDNIEDNW